jgi:hypothetical protein
MMLEVCELERPTSARGFPETVEQFSFQSTPSTIRMSRSHVLPSKASAS